MNSVDNVQTEVYDDIIDHTAYKSQKHTPMTLLNRAAQFAPFAALVGYEELIAETARQVDHPLRQDKKQAE